jgi:hypothetical protein
LGIVPHEIGGKSFFTLGLGPIFGPKKNTVGKIAASILTPFSELLPNLYYWYSPIKKLKNIFIIKIARQQHP